MDTESERIFERMKLYHLYVEHPDWSYRHFARELGHTPKWVRKWIKRFQSVDTLNFHHFQSQSRAPKTRRKQITPEIMKVVGQLRETLSSKFHRNAGPKTILNALHHQRGDLEREGYFVPSSSRSIAAILREMGYVRQPRPREHFPLILPEPMMEWEMDFGEIRLNEYEILEFFVVVDRGTSRVVYLEGCAGYDAESALEAVARLLLLCHLPQRLRFDRDSRFVGSWTNDSYPSALVRFLQVLGVEVDICPPRRPDLKPIVERCIRTLKSEWLARFSPDNYADALNCLGGFQHYYNTDRPHFGQACRGQSPDEAFPTLPIREMVPEMVDPDAWLDHQNRRVFRRRVTSNGTIMIDKHVYPVSYELAKQQVLVHLDAIQQILFITCEGRLVRQHDIRGLLGEPMDFQTYMMVMKMEARSIERHRQLLWMKRNEVA